MYAVQNGKAPVHISKVGNTVLRHLSVTVLGPTLRLVIQHRDC